MANFYRTGGPHGADHIHGPGPGFTEHGQRMPPPSHGYGMRGRITTMLADYGKRKAESFMHYTVDMQRHLDQRQQYQETGRYDAAPTDYPAPHAPAEHSNMVIMQMFERLEQQMLDFQRDICARLQGLEAKQSPPAAEPAGRPTPSAAGQGRHQMPGSPDAAQHLDPIDEPEHRPRMPPRRPRPTAHPDAARSRFLHATGADSAAPAERVEAWRAGSRTDATDDEYQSDDEREDRYSDNGSDNGSDRGYRPAASAAPPRPEVRRRPVPQPEASTAPGQAAGTEAQQREVQQQELNQTIIKNAEATAKLSQDARRFVIHNL